MQMTHKSSYSNTITLKLMVMVIDKKRQLVKICTADNIPSKMTFNAVEQSKLY